MDFATIALISITVLVHLIGIGVFLVWFAAGKPMSVEALQLWWNKVQFMPAWLRGRKDTTNRRTG